MFGKCVDSCVAVPGVKQDWAREAGMGSGAVAACFCDEGVDDERRGQGTDLGNLWRVRR